MVTEGDLREGIDLCILGEPTPEKMMKAAAYIVVKDYLFGTPLPPTSYSGSMPEPETIETVGDSDFLQAVKWKHTSDILTVMDELMNTMQVIQPRIYDSVMRRIREL